MSSIEQSLRTCNGLTEGWCARLGLAKAFAANTARDANRDGLAPYHPHPELRDEAAAYLGHGGCAEFATEITDPQPFIPQSEEDPAY